MEAKKTKLKLRYSRGAKSQSLTITMSSICAEMLGLRTNKLEVKYDRSSRVFTLTRTLGKGATIHRNSRPVPGAEWRISPAIPNAPRCGVLEVEAELVDGTATFKLPEVLPPAREVNRGTRTSMTPEVGPDARERAMRARDELVAALAELGGHLQVAALKHSPSPVDTPNGPALRFAPTHLRIVLQEPVQVTRDVEY